MLSTVLIYLDTIIYYSPIDESRRKRGYAWPNKTRREWEFGTKDNAVGSRRRPGRDRLGPSNHRRDDDREDRPDDRDGRHGERRSSHHADDRGGDGDNSRWNPGGQHYGMVGIVKTGAPRDHLSTAAEGAPPATALEAARGARS
jgi:hypothetical protein